MLLTPGEVIGFTITGINRFFPEEIARRIKCKDKDKIIVWGGDESFLTLVDYYISIGYSYFNNGDYSNALDYYIKAEKLNKNNIKNNIIKQQIKLAREKIPNSEENGLS